MTRTPSASGLGDRLKRFRLKLLNVYPPFLGAGVRVVERDPSGLAYAVRMRLTWWNRNYVGTHFGGSLYSMCDPFFMLILADQLGPGYVVWDKAAVIRFLRPGRGTVHARFAIPAERVAEIRAEADREPKVEPRFSVHVVDDQGMPVAEVEKLLHVRRR